MPKRTRVARCVAKLKKRGSDKINAYAICQAATKQSYATGKHKRKDDKLPVGSPRITTKARKKKKK